MKKRLKSVVRYSRRLPKLFSIYLKDLKNKLVYGPDAPKYMERIWVDPKTISHMISREEVLRVTNIHRDKASGVVVDWNDIQEITPITSDHRIQYCFKHWIEGKTWEEIGVYEYMANTKSYGEWPAEKIKARFSMLDEAFEEAKRTGKLKTRKEMNPSNFREKDGILVHIANNGQPVFGGNGFHRLSIAKILELERIPACIGLVDKSSIKYLRNYRNPV